MDAELDRIAEDLAPRGVELKRDVFRQQDFIDTAIKNVFGVLRDGAVLVILVLFLFMWSLRPTLISALAIPLSLLTATLILDMAGMTLDTMTLGGFAIAIGELVDDAIVDVENVARRLRERALLPEAERPTVLATVFQASREIRSSIVSATYILMLVFVPLLLLDGLEGRLLRPLSIAYLVAIFASLVVAVTVTPVLCSYFLKTRTTATAAEPPLMRVLSRRYEPILVASVRHPRAVLVGALLLVAVGAGALTQMGRSFLPEFNEGNVTIAMVLTPGTALAESDALGSMAEKVLLADPAVVSVGRRTGRAERDEHVLGVESSELELRLDPEDPRTKDEVFADLRERLRAVPGAHFTLGQPISHRIEHMISGQRAALTIKLFGEDLGQLRKSAERLKAVIQDVPGIADLGVEQVVDVPEIIVDVDRERAAALGFSAGAAASDIGGLLWGRVSTQVYEEGTTVDVVVKRDPATVQDLDALSRLRLTAPSGAVVPISALAELRRDMGPNYVLREKVERRIALTANVEAADASGVIEQVQARVANEAQAGRLDPGVRVEYAGTFQRAAEANRRLFLYGALAMLGIAVIVFSTLGSLRRTVIVLFNLPLALVGGALGVYLAGSVLSVATTIGFITLFGIATRNGILLATRARDLEVAGAVRLDAVCEAAKERLAPILMTAVTAALGLLPLALAAGQPGSEIQAPMALVILCGLSTSTLLNMVVVPALLARWGGAAAPMKTTEPLWIRQPSSPPPLD
jgi:CzcA family heavy metal efflux pump